MRLRNFITLAFSLLPGVVCAQSNPVLRFPVSDSASTMLIRVTWVDDLGPHQTTGTGITVDAAGMVLTAKHLIPSDVAAVEIVALKSPSDEVGYQVACTPIAVVDLAYCQPIVESQIYPFPVAVSLEAVQESQAVWIRGYPKGGHLEGASGEIKLVQNPLVKTSAMLIVGYSGGPVYLNGKVIGIVHDGEPVADVNDPFAMGHGRFTLLNDAKNHIPKEILNAMIFARDIASFKKILSSDVASITIEASSASKALGDAEPSAVVPPVAAVRRTEPKDPYLNHEAMPRNLTTAYTIDKTLAEHRLFSTTKEKFSTGRIGATPGYKITGYHLDKMSATMVSEERFNISNSATEISFDFSLQSGPWHDQYRGWLKGRLILTEQLSN